MKKIKASDALRPEYDLDYGKARSNRFSDRIDRDRLVVVLDSDVSKVFTTAQSVNVALRALIEVVPGAAKKSRVSR